MSGKLQPFSLRVSEEMLDKMWEIAKEHHRSLNKEIEYALELYVRKIEQEK